MSGVSSHPLSGRVDNALSDVGEIYSAPQITPSRPVVRNLLLPEQEQASIPANRSLLPDPVRSLTQFLGPALTSACPVWTQAAVPSMRGLQKALIAHSLTLEGHERGTCLAAVSVVEQALQWRLRLQQMQMQLFELESSEDDAASDSDNEVETATETA